jgi:hypothetical protein
MSTMARAAALCVLWAASAGAADRYAVREDVPETGSNILKATVHWPVPVNKTYAELTSDEQRMVRDQYVTLGARDEPPYPRDGMVPILNDVARIQSHNLGTGLLHLAVHVDARGEPQGVLVLASPGKPIDHAAAYALMHMRYKPALCDGTPCAGDFSFRYRLETPRNFLVDWHPVFWMVPRLRE